MDTISSPTPPRPLSTTSAKEDLSLYRIQYSISEDVIEMIYLILSVICTCMCCFGIVSNIVNIIVFAKQGFQETVNVSLFAMAVSDLASLITLLWSCICVNPLLKNSDIPFLSEEVQYITGAYPHLIFVRITGWLTAFVTVERCCCVVFPLKVKAVFTVARVKVIIVAIYILTFASFTTALYTTRLGWVFVPRRNRTMVGLIFTKDRNQIEGVAAFIHSTIPSVLYFLITCLSTAILVVNLRQKSKWRQTASASKSEDKEQQTAMRDKKVIVMVIVIAVIFIVCLLPATLATVVHAVDTEFNRQGKRRNVFRIVGTLALNIEAVNSSINILVYYNMSSKYKTIFRSLFCKDIPTS